jgi:hypothetical protein
MARYFFVYALTRAAPLLRPFCAVVDCETFAACCEARAVVVEAAGDSLLYCSNVKEGTHAERLARGEIPLQIVPPHAHAASPGNAEVCYVCEHLEGNSIHKNESGRPLLAARRFACAEPNGCTNDVMEGSDYCSHHAKIVALRLRNSC